MATNNDPPFCYCCDWRYAKFHYSKLNDLCGSCASHHIPSTLGRKSQYEYETKYRSLEFIAGPGVSVTTCSCCRLDYVTANTIKLFYDCRKHYFTCCINCAYLHNSCPSGDGGAITNLSASQRDELEKSGRYPAKPVDKRY